MTSNGPPTLRTLVELREDAKLSQDEAARCLGLEGKKRRQSIADWEAGRSRPDVKRRADFIAYLLDNLRLRRDPQLVADIWTHIMIGMWEWKPLREQDLRSFYTGGIPPILLPKEPGEQAVIAAIVHAPPTPALPPNIDRLVDRSEKLAEYIRTLEEEHLAVIVGMPGVGKTSLASMLVQQAAHQPKQIFWHSFRGDTDVTNLMWKLAGFLYWGGEEWPWIWLQNSSQSHGQPLNATVLLDTMYDLMLKRGYTVCLDDFQQVDADPLAQEFGRRLHKAAQEDALSLVVTARSLPGFLQGVDSKPLGGMNEQETKQLFIERQMPPMGGDLFKRLHKHTEGNPQLLELVIVAIRQGEDPERLADALEQTDEVANYLFDQVDSGLDELDRQVMVAVALLEPAATRGAVEAVFPGQRVSPALQRLARQQLLQAEQRETDRIYSQHATVQAFYREKVPSLQERQAMHFRAGNYFQSDVKDWLYAASHFLGAKEDSRAARLATLDVWRFINQGRARQLAQVLDRFAPNRLDRLEWATVGVSRGEVHQFLHDAKQARSNYESVLAMLPQADSSPDVRQLRARARLGLGDLLQHDSLPQALQQLQEGLVELGNVDSPYRAALLIKIGTVSMALGKHQEALQAAQQGLHLLPETPSTLRMRGLITQGAVYSSQGDVAQGHPYTLQALRIAEQLQDRFRMLSILSNSGLENEIAGKWKEAEADYLRALDIAQQIGSQGEEAKLANNLGVLYTNMGHLDTALDFVTRAQDLAEELGLHDFLPFILTSLGDLHIRREDWHAAEAALKEAEETAHNAGTDYPLAEAYFLRSHVYRATDRIQEAYELAVAAIDLAQKLDLALEEGKAWRALGQALLAEGEAQPAIDAFQCSLGLLSSQNAYEAARTKVQWGLALLHEAKTVFAEFGAEKDLATVDRILHAG